MSKKILIIDDEKPIRNTLKEILEYEKYQVFEAENGKEGIDKIKDQAFDLVMCDIKMPMMDGIEVLERAQILKPELPFIMISGHATVDTAVEALKKGAFDFISKPLDLNRILVTLRNAFDKNALMKETKVLRKKIVKKGGVEIIGTSKAITEIKAMIEKVAPTDARVLITGGNGCGKELVAKQLHLQSNRKDKPFIEVNCAAIPSELIESELFGHEKGAFTSAVKTRAGKFEQAQGGTIFLDEIGDMSASAQAKVLRALQENKITRVGGDKEIKVDVRVLAATNKNLKQEIADSKFREDLYHRLSVILIHVPDLNDRRDDIAELVEHFLQLVSKEYGNAAKKIDQKAIDALTKHNWTGNIRELRNTIERLIILGSDPIQEKDVKAFVTG